MNTQNIGSRIKARRTELGLSQNDLAKRVGLSQSAIAMLESGRRQKTRELVEIARVLGVSPAYLASGVADELSFSDFQKYSKIPVVGSISFFDLPTRERTVYPPDYPDKHFLNFLSPDPKAFAFLIRGSALAPRVRDREYAVFSPSVPPRSGDTVLVQLKTGWVYVADFVSRDESILVVKELNGKDHSIRASDIAQLDRLQMTVSDSEVD